MTATIYLTAGVNDLGTVSLQGHSSETKFRCIACFVLSAYDRPWGRHNIFSDKIHDTGDLN
jgi:hypothetical protein